MKLIEIERKGSWKELNEKKGGGCVGGGLGGRGGEGG